jgi:chemotaxis protein methyltransferase CheR
MESCTTPSAPRGAAGLSATDFGRLAGLIREQFGINLGEGKKVMVELRLRKRLKATGFASHEEYVDYLFSEEGMQRELLHMVDVITTNKTDFFREPAHFTFLQEYLLRHFADEGYGIAGRKGPLNVWSAACSTGEEPYTIAMVLQDFAETQQSIAYDILGTDLSSTVLSIAAQGIYPEARVEPVPRPYRRRYLRRGTGGYEGSVRVVPELRSSVGFRRLNLLQARDSGLGPFDVVFLRNVIIYFDRAGKQEVVSQVVDRIRPGGYLFVGHSETLFDMDAPLKMVQPTIYRRVS